MTTTTHHANRIAAFVAICLTAAAFYWMGAHAIATDHAVRDAVATTTAPAPAPVATTTAPAECVRVDVSNVDGIDAVREGGLIVWATDGDSGPILAYSTAEDSATYATAEDARNCSGDAGQ